MMWKLIVNANWSRASSSACMSTEGSSCQGCVLLAERAGLYRGPGTSQPDFMSYPESLDVLQSCCLSPRRILRALSRTSGATKVQDDRIVVAQAIGQEPSIGPWRGPGGVLA